MAYRRTSITWFSLANKAYTNSQVTFYRIDPLTYERLPTLAPLYDDVAANTTQPNPLTLDGEGKFPVPIYVDEPVVALISGSEVGAHETGILFPAQRSFRGAWTTTTAYYADDIVSDGDGTKDLYIATVTHVSGVWATDKPLRWTLFAPVGEGLIAADEALASALAAATSATNSANSAAASLSSQNAAATSAGTATTQATASSGSATAAAGSASSAATSASQAATSATNSGNSATASANSATASAGSASSASGYATGASNSATAASGSATTANTAKTAAETARDLAQNWAIKTDGPVASGEYSAKHHALSGLTYSQNAASSATASATSATEASQSATSAGTSATNAATSATSAGTSATNAANSATAAATSAATALPDNAPTITNGLTMSSGVIKATNGSASAPSYTFASDLDTGMYGTGSDVVRIATAGVDRLTIDANGHMYVNGGSAASSSEVKVLQVKGPNSGAGYASVLVECGLNTKSAFFQIAGANGDVMVGTQGTNTTGNLNLYAGGASRMALTAGGDIEPAAASNVIWTGGTTHYVGFNPTTEHAAGNVGNMVFGTEDGGGWAGMTVTNFREGSVNSQQIDLVTAKGAIALATVRARWTCDGYSLFGANAAATHITPGYSGNTVLGTCLWPGGRLFQNMDDFSQINLQRSGGVTTGNMLIFSTQGSVIGAIWSNGTSTAYNTTSDYRLKENAVPLTGALDRLDQLQPKRFNFIADPDNTVDGFFAHEVQTVVPEAVTGEHDAVDFGGNPVMQGIDQAKLVPLLVAAVQELTARVEALENP